MIAISTWYCVIFLKSNLEAKLNIDSNTCYPGMQYNLFLFAKNRQVDGALLVRSEIYIFFPHVLLSTWWTCYRRANFPLKWWFFQTVTGHVERCFFQIVTGACCDSFHFQNSAQGKRESPSYMSWTQTGVITINLFLAKKRSF